MESRGALKKTIAKVFRQHKVTVRPAAVNSLADALSDVEEDALLEILDVVVDTLSTLQQETGRDGEIIDVDMVEEAMQKVHQMQEASQEMDVDTPGQSMQVIDAFAMPRYSFNVSTQQIYEDKRPQQMFPGAVKKTEIFRRRLDLVRQRVLRNPQFARSVRLGGRDESIELCSVESLLGSKGPRVVLGMLSQIKEKEFYIEDASAHFKIDLSNAELSSGLFTETCIVLAQGTFRQGVFVADYIAFPPPESKQDTFKALGSYDFLGSGLTQENFSKKFEIERTSEEAMIVFASDIHLDQPNVIEKLHRLFTGFSITPPSLIVLVGPFVSSAFGYQFTGERAEALRLLFTKLSALIDSFPALVDHSQFMLVPAVNDCGPATVLPRPAMPTVFLQALLQSKAKVVLASNPVRIRYCTQEIVIFREDLMKKMRRACIVPPNLEESEELTEHLVKTIVDQGHLCPLPIHKRPIYWDYDHSLSLYPVPDVIACCDTSEQYKWQYSDCEVFNPGCFALDFRFIVYYPATRNVEYSQVK